MCAFYFFSSFFHKFVSKVPRLVKELPQGLVALPLVADFSGGDAAGAGADVGRAILLTRVIQVAGLGSVQTVILSGHCRFPYRRGDERRHRDRKGEENRRKGGTKGENSADMMTAQSVFLQKQTSVNDSEQK